MDFLNQFPNPTIVKDDASLFSFTDKTEQKGDLPFAFGTQSSEAGEISFLNQMKSQDQGESFALDEAQKNMGGLNFLKTIYEVPESSNNLFNSETEGFPLQNPLSVPMGLDFIREGNESSFNFTEFPNKENSPKGNEEAINVDINNLFKNTSPPPNLNTNSKNKNNINEDNNGVFNINNSGNNILNVNIQSSGKKAENKNSNNNIIENNDSTINMNNINQISSFPKVINNSNNISNKNKNINITPESRSNPIVNPRQQRPNNAPVMLMNPNKLNVDINKNNSNSLPDSNNNNIMLPQIQSINLKPQIIKEKKNNLDDIDKMISLNLQKKPEVKPVNKNMNIPNELSDILSTSTMVGKRANIEPKEKDKDLQSIDNLLNFTKEPMQSYNSLINKQKPVLKNSNNNDVNNNMNYKFNKSENVNNVMIKPLSGDSFDKKSETVKPITDEVNKNEVISKAEIVKKYNDLVVRLNKIREQAKEYRNIGNYFGQLISANENYQYVYPNVIKNFLEEYYNISLVLLNFARIKNNKMKELNNEFDEDIKKYSLTFNENI